MKITPSTIDFRTIKRTFTIDRGPVYEGMKVTTVVVTYSSVGGSWVHLISDIKIIGNVIGERGKPTTRRRRLSPRQPEPWLTELINMYRPSGHASLYDTPIEVES